MCSNIFKRILGGWYMEGFLYFFRGEPDGIYFVNYSFWHFIMIFIAIIGVYFLVKYQDKIRNGKYYKLVRNILGIGLLSQQGILYLWYIFTGYSSIRESLPLYNCRIAIIFTALGLMTDKKLFKNIGVYWGVYGSILALAVVSGDPFSFPHYTLVSFFAGHIFLLWATLFILLIDEYKLNKKNLISTVEVTTIYHIILLFFNILIDANYDYLIKPPIFESFAESLPQPVYSFIAIVSFNVFIIAFYSIVKAIENRNSKKQKGIPALV